MDRSIDKCTAHAANETAAIRRRGKKKKIHVLSTNAARHSKAQHSTCIQSGQESMHTNMYTTVRYAQLSSFFPDRKKRAVWASKRHSAGQVKWTGGVWNKVGGVWPVCSTVSAAVSD